MLTPSRKTVISMRKTVNYLRVICLAAFCLISSISLAEMYKWVDEDGNTHYTQSPPPEGMEGTTIKPPPKVNVRQAQKELETRKRLLADMEKERKEKQQATIKKQQEEKQQKAKCEQARARLASYERPRVNLIDEEGNPIRATEEQRQAELAKSRELVEKLCGQ